MLKLQKIFFIGILALSVIFLNNVAMCEERELEKISKQLAEIIDPQKDSKQFQAFVYTVMPNLVKIDENYKIKEGLPPKVQIEDFMTFSYEISAIKTNIPLGDWNDQMKEDIPILASIFCTIGEVFSFSKTEDYKKQMKDVSPILVQEAYKRVIATLSLRPALYQLNRDIIKLKGFPAVEEMINLNALK